MRKFSVLAALASLGVVAGTAPAQVLSNSSIQGSYYFRYLGVNSVPSDAALSFGGTMTFDGKSTAANNGYGTFTASGQGSSGTALGPAANNFYTVYSNGLI